MEVIWKDNLQDQMKSVFDENNDQNIREFVQKYEVASKMAASCNQDLLKPAEKMRLIDSLSYYSLLSTTSLCKN